MSRLAKLVLICVGFLCYPLHLPAEDEDREYWIERYLSVSYPLQNVKVNSPFGTRKDPFTGERSTHSGIDLKARYEEVYSMFDGKVLKTGTDSRSGNFIILSHGEYTVSYCHLSKVTATVGEQLIAGDVVGITGNTGRSSGPHLHITCRYKGEIRNPYPLLEYVREVKREAVAALGGTVASWEQKERVDRDAFLERYASAAMEQQRRYGIPASVILAQMAHESAWGRSDLARYGNNYFGIKCSRKWLAAGKPYSLHDDDRPNEKFCNYETVEDCIEHHSKLLISDRYKCCHGYSPTDYHRWLVGLKAAGYATAKDYVKLCEQIIKRYKLYLYDSMAQKT